MPTMRRKARGYWNGASAKKIGGVNVEVTVPVIDGLELDEDKLFSRTGTALATEIRKSLKKGQQPDGTPLPQPQPGKDVRTPLRRSGELIDSIKQRDGVVSPSTSPRPELGSRARSNFGLLKILLSGKFQRKGKPEGAVSKARGSIDPLGSADPKLGERVNSAASKVMEKLQVKLKSKGSTKV